jgi:hypothetical protein
VSGQVRLRQGAAHESEVAERIERCGFVVNPFGQGLFKEELRAILQTVSPPLLIRWIPDLIVAHPTRRRLVWFVDAKSGRLDTGRHAIEINAVIAHLALMGAMQVPVAYVWADFRVGFAHLLRPVAQNLPIDPQAGSKTPFWLVRHEDQHPFEDVFGGRP